MNLSRLSAQLSSFPVPSFVEPGSTAANPASFPSAMRGKLYIVEDTCMDSETELETPRPSVQDRLGEA
jgi:hypothetical protein